MLVLTRKPDERVIIADKQTGEVICTVMLTRIQRKYGEVRLGFEADDNIDIWREEIWLKRQGLD